MTEIRVSEYRRIINERFGGVLRHGSHKPDGEACALEAESIARGREWSDDPVTMPDLRPLNDGPWSSDQARTDALVPVVEALWDWAEWPEARRLAWVEGVVIETVRQIIAELPELTDDVRARCRAVRTLDDAAKAAEAAAKAAAAAAEAAEAAAEAAAWAAAKAAAAKAAAAKAEAAKAEAAKAAKAAAAKAAAAKAAAAWAWAAAAEAEAAKAAAAAAKAAWAAAWAAAAKAAAGDTVLQTACRIWIEAARQAAPEGWEGGA